MPVNFMGKCWIQNKHTHLDLTDRFSVDTWTLLSQQESRERDRQTDTTTDRQTDQERERQTNRQTARQTDSQADCKTA